MVGLQAVCGTLSQIAPLRLAESWDNVGLLVGDRSAQVKRVMTCLTITPPVVDEAIEQQVDLIVAHHPLPFKGLQKITSDSSAGAMLLRLIQAGTAIYSAHTAFDSAAQGINQSWAGNLGLLQIKPLIQCDPSEASLANKNQAESPPSAALGSGRMGQLQSAQALGELATRAGALANATTVRMVGESDQMIARIAIACGSGGSFLAAAKRNGCNAMITGEATFHTCLEAEANRIGLILVGHYGSERFAMEQLATELLNLQPELTVWPSRAEKDPIQSFTV